MSWLLLCLMTLNFFSVVLLLQFHATEIHDFADQNLILPLESFIQRAAVHTFSHREKSSSHLRNVVPKEAVEVEPVKVEPVQVEPVKVEPIEVEPPKVEPSISEATNTTSAETPIVVQKEPETTTPAQKESEVSVTADGGEAKQVAVSPTNIQATAGDNYVEGSLYPRIGTDHLTPGWENFNIPTQGEGFKRCKRINEPDCRFNHTIVNTTLYAKYPLLRERVNADLRSYYERKFHKKRKMIHCDPEQGNVLPGCVYIMGDKRATVFRQQWEKTSNLKIAIFEILFDSIMEKMGPQFDNKNISFAMELRANGTMWITRRRRFEPLLTLATRDKSVGGLSGLVPSPYFLNPNWWDTYTSIMMKAAHESPWESRIPKVLFRGACGPGGIARIKLLQQRASDPRLDVAFSRVLGYEGDNLSKCVQTVGKEWGMPEEDLKRIEGYGLSPTMPQEEFSKYQYIIHMPGAATGAYSRGLQFLFMHGSIVLIWENDSVEFYYHQLVPRVHYMPVNENTLKGVLDELDSNAELRRTLLESSADVIKYIVSADNVFRRWEAALVPILDGQSDPMVLPDDACSCNKNSGLEECKHCEYVEMLRKRVKPSPQGELFNYSRF